jgi:hypothetical protein
VVWLQRATRIRFIGRNTGRSPLDDIRPEQWPPAYTTDLLDLINVIQRLVDLEPRQSDLLAKVIIGDLISVEDLTTAKVLPVPGPAKRPLPKRACRAPPQRTKSA